jgi:outer membrane protein OmpA-like peptidoglycan-associated protein
VRTSFTESHLTVVLLALAIAFVSVGCSASTERKVSTPAGNEYPRDNDLETSKNSRLEVENRRMLAELKSRGADARQSSRGIVIDLPDVYFDFNKSLVRPVGSNIIRQIAEVVLSGSRYRPIAVEGHTDSVGKGSYNRRLSMLRARTVSHELVAYGLNARQIAARGFGESRPISTNTTDEGRQKNRRVEVYIENY